MGKAGPILEWLEHPVRCTPCLDWVSRRYPSPLPPCLEGGRAYAKALDAIEAMRSKPDDSKRE